MPIQLVVVLGVLEFLVQPFSTLIHELGHAVVARRVSSGRVSIIVGRGPYLSFTLRDVRINFSLLPARGVMIRGVCRHDPAGVSWRARAMIALAGPTTTILELLVGLDVATDFWHGGGPIIRNLLALSLVGLGASAVVNLLPRTTGHRSLARVVSNDGSQAVAALRLHRAGAPLPVPVPGPSRRTGDCGLAVAPASRAADDQTAAPARVRRQPDPHRGPPPLRRAAEPEHQRDLARARTSVAPPPVR